MLSLTRRVGEQVVIGRDVIVKVLEVFAGRVRLGIEAPPGSSVRRGEVTNPNLDAAVVAVPAQRGAKGLDSGGHELVAGHL